MTSEKKKELYKKKLEAAREELLRELVKKEKPEDFGSDVDHFEEKTEEVEEFGNELAVAQVLKDHINEIDAALNKMRMGTYGVCDTCGKEISKRVLDNVPESLLCEKCKKRT